MNVCVSECVCVVCVCVCVWCVCGVCVRERDVCVYLIERKCTNM